MGQSIGGDEVHGDLYELSGDFRQATLHFGAGLPAVSPEEAAALLAEYRAALLADTTHVDLRGVPLPRAADGRRVDPHLSLERVYVRLRAVREERQRREEEARRREIERQADERDEAGLAGRLGDFFYADRTADRPDDHPIGPEVALREHGRLVILGPPGAGKSTLLRLLARRAAADAGGPLPLRVSLGYYAAQLSRGDASLVDFALKDLPERQRAAVGAAIELGNVLWLLDALDEAREHAPRVLAQLAALPGQLVLTSRPLGYAPGSAADLAHFDLLPLESGDADVFLTNWFGALAETQGYDDAWVVSRVKATRTRLDDRPGLRALLGNPLLLTFVAVLADRDPAEALPEHRAGLYRRYLEELLDSWEGTRRARAGAAEPAVGPLRGEAARAALRDGVVWLGWWLHLTYYGGRASRPPLEREAIVALAGYLQVATDYDDLRRHEARAAAGDVIAFWREAGLLDVWQLRATGGPADFLAFRHLTFQEYGAAVVLAGAWGAGRVSTRRVAPDRERAWAFLRPRLHVRAWREPLLLLGGLLGAAEGDALLGAVLAAGSPYEAVLRRDMRAGAALAGEAKDWQGAGRDALVAQIVETIQRERYGPGVMAVIRSAQLPDASVQEVLLAVSDKGGFNERQAAAETLGQIGAAAAIPQLVQMLADIDGPIHHVAAEALGKIGEAAVPYLLPKLRHGVFGAWAAADALSQIGGAVTVAELVTTLRDKYEDAYYIAPSEDLRVEWWLEGHRAAADALGRIGGTVAVAELLKVLVDGNDNDRWAAAGALGKTGHVAAVRGLLAALADFDFYVRGAAAEALGQISDAVAVPGLLAALRDESNYVRGAAAEALGRIGNAAAVPRLLEALGDSDFIVHGAAAKALGQIGDAAAVPGLLAALGDESDYVRRAAAEALGQIGDAAAVPGLLAALKDLDSDVRGAAAEALGQIGDVAAVPGLLAAPRNLVHYNTFVAAKALGKIGGAAVPGLLAALEHRDVDVRWTAVVALGEIRNAVAVPKLLGVLGVSKDDGIRLAAAEALGQIGDAAAVPGLLAALRDEDGGVRQHAAVALGQLGNAAAVPGLLAITRDLNSYNRLVAIKALGEIGDAAAVPGLLATLGDRDNKVARAAAKALQRIALDSLREPLVTAADELAGRTPAAPVRFKEEAFRVLESFAARLSAIDAAALPADDLLLPPTPPAEGPFHKR